MLMFKSMIVAAAVFLPLAVQAETYVCDFKDAGRHNTIPPKVIVELAKDGQSATVTDNIGYSVHGKPIDASFVKNTSSLLRARWTVKDVPLMGGAQSDMKFSLTYKKAKNKAFVTLNMPAFDNTDSGNGNCAAAR